MLKESLLTLTHFPEVNGDLLVFENSTLPFRPARTFVIKAGQNSLRGAHAHYQCSQVLVALSGQVEVTIDDGYTKRIYQLVPEGQGLLVPPKLWSCQLYLSVTNILLVICDLEFNEKDYIRDYAHFQKVVGSD
jgi:hypothetical protein